MYIGVSGIWVHVPIVRGTLSGIHLKPRIGRVALEKEPPTAGLTALPLHGIPHDVSIQTNSGPAVLMRRVLRCTVERVLIPSGH